MRLPITLCEKFLMLECHVVRGDLPLLFSRQSLKDFGVQLDIEKDLISINGNQQELIVTNSGHYVADLIDRSVEMGHVMLSEDEVGDTKKKATKLHRYYGHPSAKRLVEMVKNSDLCDESLISEIKKLEDTCNHCKLYKREPNRPKSSMLTSTEFNSVVCMDLKKLETGHLMLHCIDLFSRFSTTCIIEDKHRDTIIKELFKIWITLFGTATQFFSDNGGEFVNQDFLDMCDSLGIIVKTTAATSPWSNGVCERHNGLIAEAYNKIIEDVGCDPHIALAWATNAKNSLANSFGYSPYTLVFGRNPRIPGLDNINSITTLNESVVNKILAEHLNAMYNSRLAYVKANNSDKLKRALKSKIPNVEAEYFTNDRVYFKKANQKKWCGPATVIGKDGKVVFIRHGGSMFRVHVTKVVLTAKADEAIKRSLAEGEEPPESREQEISMNTSNIRPTISTPVPEKDVDSSDSEDDEFGVVNCSDFSQMIDLSEPPVIASNTDSRAVIDSESDIVQSVSVPSDNGELVNDSDNSDVWNSVSFKKNGVLDLPSDSEIRYRNSEDTSWVSGKITGPGGKVSGKNKNVFNIKSLNNDSTHHIDLSECEVEKKCVDESEETFFIEDDDIVSGVFAVHVSKERYNDPKVKQAMDTEMSAWKKYGVYREVPDCGQKAISMRWVVTSKGNGYKARLVVRGFEEQLQQHIDSPTGDKCSSRILLTLAKAHGWKVESMDIKAAFLQSQKLDRTVFVKPPRNLKKVGVIWQLEKPAYGLNDSPRNWYDSLKEFLLSIGCAQCRYDPGLFYYRVDNKLMAVMLLHVDDFLISGNTKFKKEVVSKILAKYDVSKYVAGTFKYIGMNISQDDEYITVDQFHYADSVKIVDLSAQRRIQKDSPLTSDERTAYLSLLGKLSWLAQITRPDLKWDVYYQSRQNKSPTVQHLLDLNKVVSKLNTKKRVRYPKLDLKEGGLKIVVYSDASLGNLDGKINSSRGYVVFLCSGQRACCLNWASNKISRVVSSTLESETLAFVDGLDNAEWLRGIISEVLFGRDADEKLIKIIGFTDSNQLFQSVYSTHLVNNHKLRRDVENIKERLANGVVSEIRWVASDQMLADSLTKRDRADSRKLDCVLESGEMTEML